MSNPVSLILLSDFVVEKKRVAENLVAVWSATAKLKRF